MSYDKDASKEVLIDSYNGYGNLTADDIYLTDVYERPEIGDVRIHFSYVDENLVTIGAVQTGNTFKKFKGSNGTEMFVIKKGSYTGKKLINSISKGNKGVNYFFVIVGIIFIYFGVSPVIKKNV